MISIANDPMRNRFLSANVVSLLTLFGTLTGQSWAGSPRDEVVRLIPSDMTFVILLQNLGDKTKALNDSPFFKQLEKLPLGKLLLNSRNPAETKAIEQLFKDFEVTREQLVFDLLGDAVVFAYRDHPQDKQMTPQGMVLLQARDEKLLLSLMDRINNHQNKSGELKEVKTHQYQDMSYYRRVKLRPEDGDEFFWINGKTFIFSTEESLLKAALDQQVKQPSVEKESPPFSQQLAAFGVEKSLLIWWINPRAFDREIASLAKEAQGAEKSFLTHFVSWWKAIQGIAIHFDLNQSIELGLSVRVQKENLPKAAQQFFSEMSKPSTLWQIIPEDALFAISTRMEGISLVDMIAGFLDSEHKLQAQNALNDLLRVFRPDQLKILPKGLGPDLGFWVFDPLPDEKKKTWFPQMMLAIKLRSGSDGEQAGEQLQIGFTLLGSLARLLNGNVLLAKSKEENEEITYLIYDRGFPSGFRPAFASKGGYFLLSASPESIKKFSPPKLSEPKEGAEIPLLRISFVSWKKFLTEHRDSLSQFLSQGHEESSREMKKQFDQLVENLEILDRLELNQRVKGDCTTLLLRLKPAQALQK